MKKAVMCVVSILFVFTVTSATVAETNQKSSWYIGFGLGSGDGQMEIDGESKSFDDHFDTSGLKITGNAGLGMIVNPNLHVGFDFSAMSRTNSTTVSNGTFTEGVNIYNYYVAVSYFPFTEGLCLKAAAGFSNLQLMTVTKEYVAPVYVGHQKDYTMNGYGGLVGIGYYFWIGDSFNLGLNAEYSYQTGYSDDMVDNSHFWNVYVSFYWF
jgi:hypothetical protein